MKALRTKHTGAKNGGGYWGKRAEAKRKSRKARRSIDRAATGIRKEERHGK